MFGLTLFVLDLGGWDGKREWVFQADYRIYGEPYDTTR
jgi:hypothetical protein